LEGQRRTQAQEGFVPNPELKLLEQVSEGRGAWIFDFRFSIFDWGEGLGFLIFDF
jgi:hypothetical protein